MTSAPRTPAGLPTKEEFWRRGKHFKSRGFRVGRQAHIIPMLDSTAVHSAMGTLSQVMSLEMEIT